MAELVQNSAISIFFSPHPPIAFLLEALTSLVFQGKKKKPWLLSIILLVAFLFLAGTA